MHADLKALLYEAEDHYLSKGEIGEFQNHISSLTQRLETYELLRDRELDIFQPIADSLEQAFPHEQEVVLKRALKHWLLILRYSAMAMLMNNPNFLERRLLEWLTELARAHQTQPIDRQLHKLLSERLRSILSEEQMKLMHPFLEQIQATLLAEKTLAR